MIKDRHNRSERDGDQDTDRSEELSTDDDGDQGDHRRDSERIAKEVRFYYITIDRLEYTCKDDEDHGIHRIFQ